MGGLFLLGGLASGLVLLVPVVLVLGLLVILALRHDDDADGDRAPAIYGSVIAYIGLLTVLVAATGVVGSLLDLTKEGDSFSDDATISSGVVAFIVGLAAAGLLWVHQSLFARRHDLGGAALRVHRAYLLVMCLTVALVAMAAGAVAVYQLYGIAFPGTAGTDRGAAARGTLTAAALFVGAGALWQLHWRELDLGQVPEVTATAAP